MLGFLYLLLDGFCLYVNANASFWGLISRQSYGVYIIHMIVLGGVAWILVPCSLPTWIKFILVTMLTFVLAHLIVFFYQTVKRRLFFTP
jgi:surface polysaccharide O-acyltransferase-like enzyme